MAVKFTDATIRNLKPQATRYEVRESAGFAVRVSPHGTKTFLFLYHHNGQKRRLSLGQYPDMPLKDARLAYLEARRLLQTGADPAAIKAQAQEEARRPSQLDADAVMAKVRENALAAFLEADRLAPLDADAPADKAKQRADALIAYLEVKPWTVDTLARAYIELYAKPRKRTWREDQRILDKDVLPYWGSLRIDEIDIRAVNLILDRISGRGSPIQANRAYALLHKLFAFAVQRGELAANPCANAAKPALENIRERTLTDDELKALWAALKSGTMECGESLRLAMRLQLLTACRIGEILGASWDEFDLASGWWEIPAGRMKNKRTHRVWIGSNEAKAIIKRLHAMRVDSPWVFPSPRNSTKPTSINAVSAAIHRSLAGIGMVHFTSHDLRRTVATQLGKMEAKPHIISKILSHIDRSVTAVHYNKHTYDPEKQATMTAWADRLLMITEGQQASTVVEFPRRYA